MSLAAMLLLLISGSVFCGELNLAQLTENFKLLFLSNDFYIIDMINHFIVLGDPPRLYKISVLERQDSGEDLVAFLDFKIILYESLWK